MFDNYQAIIESMTDAVIFLDSDGYVQYTNKATTDLTGFDGNELLNKHVSTFYFNSLEDTKSMYELNLARKQGRLISEGWKAKKDGSSFWGEMTISPQNGSDGSFAGFNCLLRDHSKKKQAELDLRYSEERFRLMVEAVNDYAIFMLDPTGHIITWNDGAKRIKGYSVHEILGKHFSIFYTPEDLDTRKPERELVIASQTGKYEEEGWRVKKNGSVFWANIVITALYNDQNKLVGFSKVTRDLTERKEREESILESEQRYRLLVEQVADYAIFLMDEKGRIISWNAGMEKIKGYTAKEIIGKYFSIFYPEEDILNGKPAQELKIAISEGKYEEEGWRLRKDGSGFWASVVITPVYNKHGILLGFSKVTRDLTEKKEAEKALRESYQRYRMLAEELKITNSDLSKANEELEQFTSIVSHDLQEPVRTIKSFLQLIELKLADKENEELGTYISKAITAANRMRELIQNLLQYSQLGKSEIVKEEVRLNELFTEVLQNIKTAVDTSNANIIIENNVETVCANKMQLAQLMQNLLTNALKFTDNRKPEIVIKCSRQNQEIRFTVTDNGIGIAEGDLRKIFDIFRRLHVKKEYPGTGIGLAICKKIVERHNGDIWAESEPGKGTSFNFTLHQ